MLTGQIIGSEEVIARIQGTGPALRGAVMRYAKAFGINTMGYVRSEKLSGQVLNHRSGKLIDSIVERVEDSGDTISTKIGANTPYAAIHEYGFTGTENVKSYMRRTKAQMSVRARLRVSKFAGETQVKSFSRNMNMPQRSYLRSTLNEKRDEFRTGLQEAVTSGIRQ